MRMDHLCFPLREMQGVFGFCHCPGLRIFSGNCFKLKFAFLLGSASSSPSSGATLDSCLLLLIPVSLLGPGRGVCVCVCVCVYMHVCVHGESSGRERAVHSFSRELEVRKFRKRRKREGKKSCFFSFHSLILLAAFSCVFLP